ncbi:tetratricopeptide repeat protein [Panacagrimonas sp.]|uniref:tetratricopeptide repeat protein n=1 Tax=Panacagrimonas sp. TaxID=2480088 RepID=UPI003B52C6A3
MAGSSRIVLTFGATCLAAYLVGCASSGGEAPSPSIRTLVKEKIKNEEERLPVIESEPVAPDPDKALNNYRKLLEMAPDEETRAEAQRRLADLQVQRDDLQGGTAEDSPQQLREAIDTYQALLKDRPQDAKNDRVLYQLARAQQNSGDSDAAIATLQRLTTDFPDSPLSGDGHFRRADLLYRLDRYAESEAEYATVMGYEDRTPFFEPAQYMMGWSQYRQSKFDAAIATFFDILDRELPEPVPLEVDEAIEGVSRGKTDLARDSLRVVSLSFAALGGGIAVNEKFAKDGDPRFYPLVYNALGAMLLEKQRYTDSAEAFTAFTQRYPTHALAPTFQSRVIESYTAGGFGELVIREKERYATTYDPDAPYWAGKPPSQEVLTALRGHLEDLAKFNHAQAQADKANRQNLFLVAAGWYRRILDIYPQDPAVAEVNFLLGDALLDGGRTLEAAQEYTETAYKYEPHAQSQEAALAAYQAYQKHAREVAPDQRPAALREAVDSGIRLADSFPEHASKLTVLTQSAQDLFEMKSLDESVAVAGRVLQSETPAAPELRRSAWSVTANAQFSLEDFPAAETAFTEELALTAPQAPERAEITEQLAASIYKQGEAARASNDLRKAVDDFLRVGQVTPTSKIRANADYDAATSLIELEDWPAATQVLESFRSRFPAHPLESDVDKNLALAYESDGKPAQAAAVFERIAGRNGEAPDIRREAAWQAAKLFDQAGQPVDTARTYTAYVSSYPRPLERSMEARTRLVELAKSRGDRENEIFWHRDIVRADQSAGTERSDATRTLAASSSLELGRMSAADAKRIRLTLPLEQTLASKKTAMEAAIAALNQTAAYGFADSTTAATYEIGVLYQDFGKSLMESQRPPNLQDLELEQYELLLEEQAFPFEERAIQAHESNLKRVLQGRYDEWVKASAASLVQMVPGRYAKREQSEDIYESLR